MPANTDPVPELWTLSIDQTVCIGSGRCVGLAPDLFELGQNYRSHPRVETVVAGGLAMDAAMSCPVEAITLTDAEGKEVPLD